MHHPESLGKTLKRVRESKNLSIEEVSERSRIPKHVISILEEDRLEEIKSVFYAKSFVKTYACFLGALDEPGVKEYMAKGAQQQKKPEAAIKPAAYPNKIPQVDFSIVNKYKRQAAAVVIGILIFLAFSFAIGKISKVIKSMPVKKESKAVARTQRRQDTSVPQGYKAGEIPVKEKKEEQKAKDVKKETPSEKSDFVELEVSTSDDTWLQITGDGDIVFTGSFKKGSKDTWKARKEIKLEAGNSGVIKININGKPASFSGKKGEKKEIIITKDGIK